MQNKPTQHEIDEYEGFARAASGLNKNVYANKGGGPVDTPKIKGAANAAYIGKHKTTVDHRDLTARELSGKDVPAKIAPRDPRDNTARKLSGK